MGVAPQAGGGRGVGTEILVSGPLDGLLNLVLSPRPDLLLLV